MISQTAKTTWGVALVASLAAAAYWIYSSDPVRQAEVDLLRQSAAEADRLVAANRSLQAALPNEDMDALKTANSELLTLQNKSLLLGREIASLEKALANVRVEETPEMRELSAKNQQLLGAVNQQAAIQQAAQQAQLQAEAAAQTQAGGGATSPTAQLINRLRRAPDGTLSADARKAAVDAIKGYQDANNGANAPTVNDLLPYIPAELLRENSEEQFEVLSIGPGGQETRTPGEVIRARRNR